MSDKLAGTPSGPSQGSPQARFRTSLHVQSVESAKTPETRQRRIDKSMEMLRQRQAR